MNKKRSFSKEEKLELIKAASTKGVKVTLDKHGIYPSSYNSWKRKFDQIGEQGLSHGMTKAYLKEIRRLEKENQQLKQIVAEKELEGKLKDELLKRRFPWASRGN